MQILHMINTFEVYKKVAIDESTDEEVCKGEKTSTTHPRRLRSNREINLQKEKVLNTIQCPLANKSFISRLLYG